MYSGYHLISKRLPHGHPSYIYSQSKSLDNNICECEAAEWKCNISSWDPSWTLPFEVTNDHMAVHSWMQVKNVMDRIRH